MPDRNAQWIIGALIAVVVSAAVALGTQISGLRVEIRAIDDRLRTVEINVAQLQQQATTTNERLLTIERHLLDPGPAPGAPGPQ